MNSFEGRAHRMQWDVPPMSNNAGARLIPFAPPVTGEIIPMERLLIEFTVWPFWETVQRIALRDLRVVRRSTRERFRERIVVLYVRTDADDENAAPALRHAKMLRV